MPTTKATTKPAAPRARDAIALLTADHKEVRTLFNQYDKLAQSAAPQKQQLKQQICNLLTVHATLEEELFYPAAREVLGKAEDLVDEAAVEHASAKDLVAQIEGAPTDPLVDAKVKVLGEYIEHHAKEEEQEMFPKLRDTALDLKALGIEMAARKVELMDEVMAVKA